MSQHIVVSFSATDPEDFDAGLRMRAKIRAICDELRPKLQALGVELSGPRIVTGEVRTAGKPGRPKKGKAPAVSVPRPVPDIAA